MKLEVNRRGIRVLPENDLEEAFLDKLHDQGEMYAINSQDGGVMGLKFTLKTEAIQ